MPRFTTSLCRRLAPGLALAGAAGLAACGSRVDVTETAGGTGSGGATSSSAAVTTTSSSSSGSGGGSVIGPLACLPGEGAIVAGTTITSGVTMIAVDIEGTWHKDPAPLVPSQQTVAYVDVDHRLSVLWTDQVGGVDQAHFVGTQDGTSFEVHDVMGWHPEPYAPIFSVGDSILVESTSQGVASLAYYDPDAFDWMAWTSTPFTLSSAAAGETGPVVLVGLSPSHALCDITLDSTITWGPVQCHPELPVWIGSEITAPLPHIVKLPSGDVVAVYNTSYVDLAAVVLHEGKWSVPFGITLTELPSVIALAPTPTGDVLTGFISPLGSLHVLRFSPNTGWGASILVDTDLPVDRPLAAAPGICGDDALFAYAAATFDGEIRVARVRGDASATTTVVKLVEDTPYRITLASRRAPIE